MIIPRPLDKETLFEETHAGQGRIMESGGFYYAEAKLGGAWRLVQFSEFPQVVRMALDHALDEQYADWRCVLAESPQQAMPEELRRCELAGQPRVSGPLPLADRRIYPVPFYQ